MGVIVWVAKLVGDSIEEEVTAFRVKIVHEVLKDLRPENCSHRPRFSDVFGIGIRGIWPC